MDCYIEILAGLIRWGPDAHVFPNPYVGTVIFSADKQIATLKGLVIPQDRLLLPNGEITTRRRYSFKEYRELHEAIHDKCRLIELNPIFERARMIKGALL